MKKLIYFFTAGILAAGTACSSTDATTDDTTETTTETTTDAAVTPEAGVAGADPASMTEMDDATFVMTAASSNMLEIQLGNMALQNASDPKVREFAQMMVDHHTKANEELKTVANQLGATIPQTLLPMHQAMMDKLAGKTGSEFDEDYMDTMETAHKMDIAMFEAKTNNATDPGVKMFAAKTLPSLMSHQKMANDMEDSID